jgi:phospholipid/cholesterol/gamma-HCH transport system permease protein
MESARSRFRLYLRPPPFRSDLIGRGLFRWLAAFQGLGSFALITFGVMLTKFNRAGRLIRPSVVRQTARSGLELLPMTLFVSCALGLVIIGQSVSWLTRVGAINYLGSIMVIVVVRELGPLLAALLVLTRVGVANVIELGTSRALGEVEALEALGVDPVHYLVVPRVAGMAVGVFSLTVYLILGALLSGYLWAFIQDVPLRPSDYFRQLASSLHYMDFVLLALKSLGFGSIISVVTSYHGLAHPLRLEQVSSATVKAVAQSIVVCLVLDAVFLLVYMA